MAFWFHILYNSFSIFRMLEKVDAVILFLWFFLLWENFLFYLRHSQCKIFCASFVPQTSFQESFYSPDLWAHLILSFLKSITLVLLTVLPFNSDYFVKNKFFNQWLSEQIKSTVTTSLLSVSVLWVDPGQQLSTHIVTDSLPHHCPLSGWRRDQKLKSLMDWDICSVIGEWGGEKIQVIAFALLSTSHKLSRQSLTNSCFGRKTFPIFTFDYMREYPSDQVGSAVSDIFLHNYLPTPSLLITKAE